MYIHSWGGKAVQVHVNESRPLELQTKNDWIISILPITFTSTGCWILRVYSICPSFGHVTVFRATYLPVFPGLYSLDPYYHHEEGILIDPSRNLFLGLVCIAWVNICKCCSFWTVNQQNWRWAPGASIGLLMLIYAALYCQVRWLGVCHWCETHRAQGK